ncbi:MAG: type II secretion system secretin GspD [Legionellales bacterium]
MLKRIMYPVLTLCCCFMTVIALAQEPLPPLPQQADLRQWNLQNVDVKNVVEEVARVTGKNFIIDPNLSGNVTVISNQQMTPDELYELFLSMLQVLGYAAVESADAIKIVPDAKARQLGTFIATDAQPGSRDAIVARVISVEHVPAAQLVPVLRNLVSPEGHLAAYAPSNSLLVVDRGENATRLADIVHKLDRAETDGIDMIMLENASADEVVASLEALVAVRRQGDAAGGQVAISSDERSNSILLSGDKSRRLQLQAIIAQLDVTVEGEGNTEVIYLRFQRAEDLVPVLANIMDSYASAQDNTITPGAALAQVQQQPVAAAVQITPSSEAGEGYRTFTDRQATGVSVGGYGIHAEPNMNALVMTAPPALMRSLRSVITQLDVRRAQVMVEAIIVEIEDTELEELGIEWRGGGNIIGGTAFPNAEGFSPLDAYQATLDAGGEALPGAGLNVGFIHNGSIKFLINALSSNVNANILSTPSLVALDNAEAQITVGNQIPFKIGEYATTGDSNTVEPFNTFEYREVGLTLRIKPQITQGDAVVLQIQQNVDSIGTPTAEGEPTTIVRDITTSVLVNDKDILVLGGLIRTQENDNTYKVPYLGDLPLIGNFFRAQNTTTSKTNLMIFMRPTILRDRTESLEVTGNKYNWMRNQQVLDNTIDYEKQIPESHGRLAPFEEVEPMLPKPFQPSKDVADPHIVLTTDDFPDQ